MSDRINSSSGEWSGNLYDFFYRIAFKITEDIPTPFKMKGIFRDDNVPMKKAIREALCNTLSNADFHMELGVVIKQYHDKIVFSNPGALAIPKKIALLGGTSKARNKNILSIFSYVNIGERGGTGIPLIITATKEENLPDPILEDSFNPDQTRLTIFIKNNENLHFEDKNLPIETENLPIETENLPIEIIQNSKFKTDVKDKLVKIVEHYHSEVLSRASISSFLSVSDKSAYNLIKCLKDLDLIESVKGHGKGKYKFK